MNTLIAIAMLCQTYAPRDRFGPPSLQDVHKFQLKCQQELLTCYKKNTKYILTMDDTAALMKCVEESK